MTVMSTLHFAGVYGEELPKLMLSFWVWKGTARSSGNAGSYDLLVGEVFAFAEYAGCDWTTIRGRISWDVYIDRMKISDWVVR